MSDPIERAKAHAEQMYPNAEIRTRNHAGKPLVLAIEDDLIRLVRLVELGGKHGCKPRHFGARLRS